MVLTLSMASSALGAGKSDVKRTSCAAAATSPSGSKNETVFGFGLELYVVLVSIY